MRKTVNSLVAKPAFFLLAALFWGVFMCGLNFLDRANFQWHDLLVEANGLVFDLLVFGFFLSIYEGLKEDREKTERLVEEIEDYRGWNEKEATFRIVGAIKRLNRLGISEIDLRFCFLKNAELQHVDLFKANLQRANLQKAQLRRIILMGANLIEANCKKANLRGANLWGANFQQALLNEADLFRAHLNEAILWEATLQGANLRETDLENADLRGANLKEALVDNNWFEKLEKWNVQGIEEIKAKYLVDESGILREK